MRKFKKKLAFSTEAAYNKHRNEIKVNKRRNETKLAKLSKGSDAKLLGLKSVRVMTAWPPKAFHHCNCDGFCSVAWTESFFVLCRWIIPISRVPFPPIFGIAGRCGKVPTD